MAEVKTSKVMGIWRARAERSDHPTFEVSALFNSPPSEEHMAQRLLSMVHMSEITPLFEVDRESAASLQLAGFGYSMSPVEFVAV